MKYAHGFTGLLACLIVLAISVPASAAITLYDKEATTFSVDGSFNTFYVYSDSDNELAGTDHKQSRIKMGFLPNWIGFNFSKQAGGLKLGGRSSFWVSINDSNNPGNGVVDSQIDIRQFYGTIDASWGQVLIGKDFALFNRTNIFLDEILLGYGNVSDTLGLIGGNNVSFGNIGSGYTYPTPNGQITYRSPNMAGFSLAIGALDPTKTSGGEEKTPRFEGELTYSHKFGNGSITTWLGFLTQESENAAASDVDSQGISFGVQGKIAGLTLHASGFDGEGIGFLLGTHDAVLGLPVEDNVDANGYLLQASYAFGPSRIVASYGKNELDKTSATSAFAGAELEDETVTAAYFHTVNDNLKLVAEYNINTIEIGSLEEETKTIALGAIINF